MKTSVAVDLDRDAPYALTKRLQSDLDLVSLLLRNLRAAFGQKALVALRGAQEVLELELRLSDVVVQPVVRGGVIGALKLHERRAVGAVLEQLDAALEVRACALARCR